ncbi:MAG: glycosyltransferase family 4 protein [Bacteroidota bacterium]
MKRVAIVLWSGEYGGAETWSLALAKALVRHGWAVGIVVVGDTEPLCDRLRGTASSCRSLGLTRGRGVLLHGRRFASLVTTSGADAAVLPSAGYLSAALRLGGYRGTILAVEHGTLLQLSRMDRVRRLVRRIDTLSGSWAVDAHVVPSEFMLREIRRHSYGRHARRIHLGIEFTGSASGPAPGRLPSNGLVLGFAGRLVRGKGLDVLLEALSLTRDRTTLLEVAGDGPERQSLEARAAALGIRDRVRFRGWVADLDALWRVCDVAVVPSTWTESFGMVAVEAMAAGLPVIAARNGGLAEIVIDGETGSLFEPGDAGELARLIETYAQVPIREQRGALARARARSWFDIDRCAQEFMELIGQLSESASRVAAVVGEA